MNKEHLLTVSVTREDVNDATSQALRSIEGDLLVAEDPPWDCGQPTNRDCDVATAHLGEEARLVTVRSKRRGKLFEGQELDEKNPVTI